MKEMILSCCLLLLCRPAYAEGRSVMAYSNQSRAAEIDDTARYYHDKYYPQLKLLREDELGRNDEVALLVGSLDVSPLARELIWQYGIDAGSWTFSLGGENYSRNCGLIVRQGEYDRPAMELRTGLYWQAAWTTFYVSSAAVDNALGKPYYGEEDSFLVSYPSQPEGVILRYGRAHRDSAGPHIAYAGQEQLPDPCGEYYGTLATSTGAYLSYHYPRGSWAGKTIGEFIPRTEKELDELKEYFGLKRLRHMDYYLFDSLAEKEACTGVRGNAHGMTNAGEPEVFAVRNSSMSATGKHEFIHLLAEDAWGRSGSTLIREGLAVALEGYWQGKPFGYWGPELRRRGALPSLHTLLTDMPYWYKNSSEAYAAAGNFTDMLMQRYGKEKVKEIYTLPFDEASAGKVFGEDLAALEKAWRSRISAQEKKGDAAQ